MICVRLQTEMGPTPPAASHWEGDRGPQGEWESVFSRRDIVVCSPEGPLIRLRLCLWGPRVCLILFLQAFGSEETCLHLE